MFRPRPTRLAAAVAATLLPAAAALAQAPDTPARADPADPSVAVPQLTHRSSLAAYRRQATDLPPLAWREANDRVERIGGWRAYAREAQAPDAAVPPAAPPAPTR